MTAPLTPKAERTRAALIDTALRLFRERGYDATTMRLIASEAGVSQGNAYYYFDGKDAFVQELYARVMSEHTERALPLLRQGADLADNLRAVLHALVDTMAPYHAFGATLVSVAISPGTSVSPFSPESGPAREAAHALVVATLEHSRGVPNPVPARLPDLVWLAQMGVTLHWVTDRSPDQRRTRTLIDGVTPLIARTVALSRLPVARSLAGDAYALVDRLTTEND